jgi:hypothetical protein
VVKKTDDIDGWLVSCSYKSARGSGHEVLAARAQYSEGEDPLNGTVRVRLRSSAGESAKAAELSVTVKDLTRFCNGVLGAIQADLASYRGTLAQDEESHA